MIRRTLTAGAIAAFFFLPLALDIPLIDPDEGLHAAIAQDMVDRGQYAVPTLIGKPFLDKPILFFWTEALSLKLFGMHDAAARLPGLLFGLLGATSTGLVAKEILGAQAGLLAACFYATMLLPFAESQAGGPDVAIVPWINFAMLFVWRAGRSPRLAGLIRDGALAGLFVALSLLTKGLVGLAIVCLTFGGLWAIRRTSTRTIAAIAVAAAVGVVLALPWYLTVEHQSPGYLRYYFVDRHLLGYIGTDQRHAGAPWWYYAPILIGGGLPWIVYLPLAIASRLRPAQTSQPIDLAWVWLAGGFVFFTLGQSKLPTYVLPLFPPVAILAAHAWTRLLAAGDSNGRPPTVFLAAHLAVMAVIVPVTMLLIEQRYVIAYPPALWLTSCAPAAAAWLVWRFAREARAALKSGLALSAATLTIGVALLSPEVAETTSAEDVAQHFNQLGTLPAQVWLIDDRIGSVIFYLDPALRARVTPTTFRSVSLASARDEIAGAAPPLVLAVRHRRLESFTAATNLTLTPTRGGEFHYFALPPASPIEERR